MSRPNLSEVFASNFFAKKIAWKQKLQGFAHRESDAVNKLPLRKRRGAAHAIFATGTMVTIESLIAVICLCGTFFSIGFSIGKSLGAKK